MRFLKNFWQVFLAVLTILDFLGVALFQPTFICGGTIVDPPPTPGPGPFVVEMEKIPAGKFQMGSYEKANEQPVHEVYVDGFHMDKDQVTNAQYKVFIDANPEWQRKNFEKKYGLTLYLSSWGGWKGNKYPKGKGNLPVEVPWHAAMAYARWVDKRLPTEAEWEKAARGKYNLYNVVGKKSEWCLDEYDSDFYANSPYSNPISGENITSVINNFTKIKSPRVVRGGSRYSRSTDADLILILDGEPNTFTARNWDHPINDSHSFRCVKAQ